MILQHDGFDHYGTGALHSAATTSSLALVSDGYTLPTGTCGCGTAYGKNSGSLGVGITVSTVAANIWLKKPIKPEGAIATNAAYTPQKLLVLGFAARFPIALTGRLNFAKLGGVSVSIGTDWLIYVDDVATTYSCEMNVWNFIELKIDLVANLFQLYMGGDKVYEKAWTVVTLDFWEIRGQMTTGSGTTIQLHVDDVHLIDGNPKTFDNKDTTNVDRIGKSNTLTRYPTADSTVAMAPSSGTTNFNMVNQATPDDDSTYVASNVAGTTDFYTNLTAFTTIDDAAIRAVTIAPSARMLEPDSLSLTAVVKVDTSESVGYRMALKAGSYSTQKHIFEVSPKTNKQWTPTEALNVRFGQRILAKPTT